MVKIRLIRNSSMNTEYNLNVDEKIVEILRKSISTDLKAAHTAIKILLLKSLSNEEQSVTESPDE